MDATLPENFQFSKIRTECKNCCFAEYDGKTQTGCAMGVLEKIPENVVAVYDEEKEFFVINDKHCHFCRNQEWAEFHKDENLEHLARAQCQLKISYFVWYDETSNVAALKATLKSADEQYLRPYKITIINNSKKSIRDVIRQHKYKTPVEIENILVERDKDDLIHYCVNKSKSWEKWFGIFHSGCHIPPTFNFLLNKRMIEDFKRVVVVLPNDFNDGGCFNRFIFNGAVGNKEMNFFAKMREIYNQELMPTASEVCPDFQK